MAKNKSQSRRSTQVTRLLLLVVLAWSMGLAPAWGEQRAQKAVPSPKAAPSPAQKHPETTPEKSDKPAAEPRSEAAPVDSSAVATGKRDPFKVPVYTEGKGPSENMMASAAPGGGVLPQGTRGLLISQLRLEGVVREEVSKKMIAVVTNETRRAYFLSENQPLYNGTVSKITLDAVYFEENTLDSDGRMTTREVVKRLSPASGEGR